MELHLVKTTDATSTQDYLIERVLSEIDGQEIDYEYETQDPPTTPESFDWGLVVFALGLASLFYAFIVMIRKGKSSDVPAPEIVPSELPE